MDRIEFLKRVAAGGSLLLLAPAVFNSCSKDEDMDPVDNNNATTKTIDLTSSTFSALGTVGGYVYFSGMIVFRTGDNSYMALSQKCTHQNCDVTYDHSNGNVPCPCHGSVFTTGGSVVNGPAPTSLKKYSVVKEGNTLKIT